MTDHEGALIDVKPISDEELQAFLNEGCRILYERLEAWDEPDFDFLDRWRDSE